MIAVDNNHVVVVLPMGILLHWFTDTNVNSKSNTGSTILFVRLYIILFEILINDYLIFSLSSLFVRSNHLNNSLCLCFNNHSLLACCAKSP